MGFSFQTTKELRLQEVEDTLGMKNEDEADSCTCRSLNLLDSVLCFYCSGFEKANRLVHF